VFYWLPSARRRAFDDSPARTVRPLRRPFCRFSFSFCVAVVGGGASTLYASERKMYAVSFIRAATTAASSVTVCLDAAARCLSCHHRRRCSRRRRRRRPIGFIINFALMNDDFFIMLLSNGRPYYAFNALPLYVTLTLPYGEGLLLYCLALRPSADPMRVCLSSLYLMYRVAQIKLSQRLISDIYRQRTTPKFTRLKWPPQLGMLGLYQSRPKNISEYPMGLSRTISDIKGNLCINVPTPVYLTPRRGGFSKEFCNDGGLEKN